MKKAWALWVLVLVMTAMNAGALAATTIRVKSPSDIPPCAEPGYTTGEACWDDAYCCDEHWQNGPYTLILEADIDATIHIPVNASVTLDLNGHKLTGVRILEDGELYGGLAINNMGTFAIRDSAGGGKLIGNDFCAISSYGYVIVESGTITHTGIDSPVMYNNGDLTIRGGLFVSGSPNMREPVITHADEPDCPGPEKKMRMTGGEIRQLSKKAPALVASFCSEEAAISGGLITAAGEAVRVRGKASISGGQVKGDVVAQIHPRHGFSDVNVTIDQNAEIDGDVMYLDNEYNPPAAKPWNYKELSGPAVAIHGGTVSGRVTDGIVEITGTYVEKYDEYELTEGFDLPIRLDSNAELERQLRPLSILRTARAEADEPIAVSAGVFGTSVPSEYLIGGAKHIATLASSGDTWLYYGQARSVAGRLAQEAQPGDTIQAVSGDLNLSNIPAGVTVKRGAGAGNVTVNGVAVENSVVVEGPASVDSLPQTGDNSRLVLWTALLVVCGIIFAASRRMRRV